MCSGSSANATVAGAAAAALRAAQAHARRGANAVAAAPPLTDSSVRWELLEELDARGAAGELLGKWAQQEDEVLRQLSKPGRERTALPQKVREVALKCLHGLTSLVGLSHSGGWFDAVLLLDGYCLARDTPIEALPAACTAIVSLLKKSDSGTGGVRSAGLSQIATQAAQCLRGMGYAMDARVTAEDIREQETAVLDALGWQIHRPSVHAWLSLLCERLNVLTQRSWTTMLEWIQAKTKASAGILLFHHAAYAPMSPQRMANGLFCLFLVVACWVPLETIRPAHLTAPEWEELFAQSKCQGAAPSRALPPSRVTGVLDLLQVVSGRRLANLQEDTHVILLAMRRIAIDFASAPVRRTCWSVQI